VSNGYASNQEFMLPASTGFIVFSLFVAVMLNWLPWSGWALADRKSVV
jgi:hypothetical protein